MQWHELVTPGGLIALIVALAMAYLRYKEDRPRIRALEADKKETDSKLQSLKEANAGLVTLVQERLDFTTAVKVMTDVVTGMKVAQERHDAHMRATSEEHTEMIAVLRDLKRFLEKHNGDWDKKTERRRTLGA